MSKKESKTIIHLEETGDRFEFKCNGGSTEIKALLSIACGLDPNFLRAITEVVEGMKNPELREAVSEYAVRLNEIDANGIIINKNAINIKDSEQIKVNGNIVDHEIDDNGVKIIKKFDLRSVSL